MRKYFDLSSMPNQSIASGIHATGGMGRTMLNIGLKMASTGQYMAMSRPRATPTAEAQR